MSQQQQQPGSEAKKKELIEQVMNRINLLASGGFVIPDGYLVENEVRQAYFLLTQPRNGEGDWGKPIMDVTTEESQANALFNMVAAGLSAIRNQCYFIPYGNVCQMQRSYFGSIAIARRIAYVTDVDPITIHEGDKFTHVVKKGKIVDVIHEQELANLDRPIVGAYVYVTFQDNAEKIEVMTIAQIRKSWNMSKAKGDKNKLQTQFDVEAAKRTVINRALKPIINASQDANLWQKDFSDDEEDVQDVAHEVVQDSKRLEPKTVQLPPAQERITVPVEQPKAAEPEPRQTRQSAKPAKEQSAAAPPVEETDFA